MKNILSPLIIITISNCTIILKRFLITSGIIFNVRFTASIYDKRYEYLKNNFVQTNLNIVF